ncbi:MAG TPA: hypothetical protein VFA10_20140 [Ktedonobacteraceae bacterium]|nr:hypothetical protein [Ktedonobacteraceae bacterium]
MKKDTLLKKLAAQAQKIEKVTDEVLRTALQDVHTQCCAWTDLPWTEISRPVVQKINELGAQGKQLLEKEKQGQLSEEERATLMTLREIYRVYYWFYLMVAPTAKRANREKRRRPRYRSSSLEDNQRQAS